MKFTAVLFCLVFCLFISRTSAGDDNKTHQNDTSKKEISFDKSWGIDEAGDTISSPDIFIKCETQPMLDMKDLQKNIVYPEDARKAGVKGKVIVRLWVDKNGKPNKVTVIKSDSKLLNDAALKAVKNTKFYPAKQHNKPVGCWLTIPIKFNLTDK